MRTAVVLLVICCCLSTASGQWLESWVTLPDSLAGVTQPGCFAYDSVTNTVWVGGSRSDRLLAIDATSNAVVGMVRLPVDDVNDHWYLCGATAAHSLFCVMSSRDSVFVVDCSSHTLVAAIRAQDPGQPFYNPIDNKVYCTAANGTLLVIDATTNQLIKTLSVYGSAMDFCLDSQHDVIYMSSLGGYDAIDGRTDSVLYHFSPGGYWHNALCYSPDIDRVYCAHYVDDTVQVLHGDTVYSRIAVGSSPYNVCYNSTNDKVYTANFGSNNVSIIRCDSNRVIATVPTGGEGRVICYDSVLNRVYCAVHESIVVINGATNAKVGRITTTGGGDVALLDKVNHALYRSLRTQDSTGVQVTSGVTYQPLAFVPTVGAEHPKTVCWNSLRNKVYVACQGTQQRLAVIDGASGGILDWISTGIYPCALAYDPILDRVYCAESGSASVTVVDCATDSAIASIRVGEVPVVLLCMPGVGKVYCANRVSGTVSVIDASTNLVTKTIHTGTAPCALAYGVGKDRVYCVNSGSGTVGVIDQSTDSLVASIRVKDNPCGIAYSPSSERLFCTHTLGDTALAIDCRTDSVVGRIYAPYQHDIGYDSRDNWVYISKQREEMGHGYDNFYLGIAVVDCATLQVVSAFDLEGSPSASMSADGRLEFFYNSINARMYCRANLRANVYVYDGAAFVRAFGTGGFGGGFAWNERQNRMYVACDDDSRIAVIRDVGGGVEEGQVDQQMSRAPEMTTIARGVLFLPAASGSLREAPCVLFNINGRAVMALHSGLNDIRQLPAGVYFLRWTSEDMSGAWPAQKVVVSR